MAKRDAVFFTLALLILCLANNAAEGTGSSPRRISGEDEAAWAARGTEKVALPQPSAYSMSAAIAVGSSPMEAVMTPNGQEVYVTNMNSNTVSVISTATNTVTNTVPVGTNPMAIAVSPDGSRVYVGNNGGTTVSVIDTSTKNVSTVNIGASVRDLAVSQNGDRLYVAGEWGGLIKVDTASYAVTTISSVVCPEGVVFVPNTTKAYVDYQCAPPPGSSGNDPVYEFNAATDAYVTGFTVGPPQTGTNFMAASPDGSKIWVPGSGPVRVVSTSTDAVIGSITPPNGGGWETVSPDSDKVYIANGTSLYAYDTSSYSLIDTIPLAASGSLAFTPSGCRFYAPVPGSNSVAVVDQAPAAPAAPTFTDVSCTSQTINWAPVPGATCYEVWRGSGTCGSGCTADPYTADASTLILDHFDGSTLAAVSAYTNSGSCGGPYPAATARSFWTAGTSGIGQALGMLAPSGQPAGSGSYVAYPGTDRLSISNGTLEYWVYLTDYNGAPDASQGPYFGACAGWTFGMGISSTGQLSAGAWAAFSMNSGTTVVPLNQWVHLACSWGASGAKLYINGQLVGSDSNTGHPAPGYGGYLRVRVSNSGGVNLVDELRLSSVQRTAFNTCRVGCAVTPYSTDSNTVISDHFDGSTPASIAAYAGGVACGGPAPSATANYYWASGGGGLGQALWMMAPSGQPAGSGTYLTYPGLDILSTPNGTLEYWVYLTDYNGAPGVDQGPYIGACSGWTFGMGISSAGQLSVGAWNAFSMNSGATVVPLNQWVQVACSWGAAGAKLYINGQVVGTDSNTNHPASGFGGYMRVRVTDSGGVNLIDELRLSNVQRTSFNLCAGLTKATPSYAVSAPIGVGNYPVRAAMTPNGKEVYVTNQSDGTVSVISTATNAVTNTLPVGTNPYAVVAHPDGSKVYVGCMGGNVYVINTATKAVTSISCGSPVNDMSISNSGDRLYLAMEFSALKKIVTATGAVSTINSTVCPEGVVFVPKTNKAYVNYQCAPGGFGTDPVYEYNATTDAYVNGFTVGTQTASNVMAASPDGSKVWVDGSGLTRCVRTSDDTTLGTISPPSGTWMTTVSPDSARAYISNGGTELRVYNTSTLSQVATVSIAASGSLAFNTSGSRFYAPIPGINAVDIVDLCYTGGTSFTDTGLTPGTTYSYYIVAKNDCGTSMAGPCATSTTTPPVPAVPSAPAVADADPCATSGVNVSWGAVANATSYDLLVDSATTVTGVTSPYTYSPSDGNSHDYQVRAGDTCGSSAWSTATPGTDANNSPAVPGAPGVSDVDVCAMSGVSITWADVSGATGYDLQVDGATVVTGVTSPHTYSPGDTNSHDYQVRSKNATCTSGWSTATAAADQALAPPAITGLLLQKLNGNLLISWTPPSDSSLVDYYQVMRSLAPQGPFDTVVGTTSLSAPPQPSGSFGILVSLTGEPPDAYYLVRGVKGSCIGPLE